MSFTDPPPRSAAESSPAQIRPRDALRLIVHGDDFGLSTSVNDGIVRAHVDGILTAASLIAAGDAFEAAVDQARAHPSLDLGVHLTLTELRPVSAPASVPSLLADGARFWPSPAAFVRRYLRGAVSLADVEREWDAQIARVVERGLPVSHLDGHQHLHALPHLRAIAVALAQRYGIRFVRRPRERVRRDMFTDLRRLGRAAQLVVLNRVCAIAPWPAPATDHFAGFYFGGRLDATNLLAQIEHLPSSGSCELMCHPGMCVEPHFDANYDRRAELDALCNPTIRRRIDERGVQCVTFADLIHESDPPRRA